MLIISKVGFWEIKRYFTLLEYPLYIAFFCSLVFTFLKAFKWHLLLRRTAKDSTYVKSLRSYLLGMAFGLLTPARVGEVGRFLGIRDQKKSIVIILVAVDKVFDITVVLVLSLMGIFYFTNYLVLLGTLIALVLVLGVLFFPNYPTNWINRLFSGDRFLSRYMERFRQLSEKTKSISQGFKRSFFAITFLCYLTVIVEYYFLVNNYASCSILAIFAAQPPLVMLSNLLPITVGGLGVREGASAILLSPFDIPGAVAVSSAFMIFLFNSVLPAICGALLLFRGGGKKSK
jgi:uncharacterized protein (TIRG00374 family)